MIRVGCHLSSSKGYLAMGKMAVDIGANTFQFFSRNPRGGAVKAFDAEDANAYLAFAKEHDITLPLTHAPYVLNLAAKREDLRDFAKRVMKEDIERLSFLPDPMYNFHPGAHVQQGEEMGVTLIAQGLNEIITPETKATILLETMAGKGTEIGGNFAQLRRIIDLVDLDDKVGVCLDTCHVYDAGYDIVNTLDDILQAFDETIGFSRLRAIHLNDSVHGLSSHKDRHAKLGEGTISLETFDKIINHSNLCHLPFYLETPNELDGYAKEIKLLKKYYQY